jgi:hypothetical protein
VGRLRTSLFETEASHLPVELLELKFCLLRIGKTVHESSGKKVSLLRLIVILQLSVLTIQLDKTHYVRKLVLLHANGHAVYI